MVHMEKRSILRAAWDGYQAEKSSVYADVFDQPWIDEPGVRLAALRYLREVEAAAYNLVVGPNPEFPAFYINIAFEPGTYSYAFGSVDFLYRRCFLDGRSTYRIWGRRNSSQFIDFQILNVFYGQDGPRTVSNRLLDDFHIEADGSFEVILSADPHDGNWLELDRDSGPTNYLNTREAFYDWENEQGCELYIERIGGPAGGVAELEPHVFADRLHKAGKFYRFIVENWGFARTSRILEHAGYNNIFDGYGPVGFVGNQGAMRNPGAIYPFAVWKVASDEALIFEATIPDAGYWSIQLGNIWWQVLDFASRQTSINGYQAVTDADGRFRAVICDDDPGVPNWLDTMGHSCGILLFRQYHFDSAADVTITCVKKAELRQTLPADTQTISPLQRANALQRRARAVKKRYGY